MYVHHCSQDSDDESGSENVISAPMPEDKPDLTNWILPATDYYWTSHENCQLHLRYWAPAAAKDVRGTLFYVHGYAGHINRPTLTSFLARIASAGYVIFGFDIKGHGYSPGERCLVHSFNDILDDCIDFADLVFSAKASIGNGYNLGVCDEILIAAQHVRFGLVGESMGGALALLLANQIVQGGLRSSRENSFKGTVALSPALAVSLPSPWMQAVLRNTVVPMMPSSAMPQWVSSGAQADISDSIRDEQIAAFAIQDDWGEAKGALGWRKPMKWGTAGAFSALYSTIDDDLADMTFPFAVLHDPDDAICDYAGTQRLMKLSPSKDKQVVDVPGGLHGISCNEPEFTASTIIAFFAKRM